mgnify:FL=1
MKKGIIACLSAFVLFSASVYAQDLNNYIESLAGKCPGLIVIDNDAMPGSGIPRLMVRGLASYAEGTSNTVKIYVDGFEVQSDYVNYLNPDEIESVQVIRDAASLALYGTNGANGVLLITTKKGNIGAPVVTFRASGGVQTPINVAKPLSSYDYANLYNQAYSNDNGREWDTFYDFEQLADYKSGAGVNVSWYDEVMKNTGAYADAMLSFRGGSQFAKYNVVMDYANQQGFLNVANTDRTSNLTFGKYGLRTNLDMKINDVLSASVNIGGRLEDRGRPNYSVYSLMEDVMRYPSNIYPIYDEASTDPISNYSGTAIYPNNPVGSLKGLGWTTSRTKVLNANFKFREDLSSLLKGLYLEEGFSFYSKTIGNMGKTRNYARYYNGTAQTSDVSTYLRSSGYSSSGKERWMQGTLNLGWNGTFDAHALDASLGAHISSFNGNGYQFYNWKYRYVNYNGHLGYTYDNRYVAALNFSYFGSDAYAPTKRFSFYPSASFAWIASNEDFLKGNDIVNNLKVRTSVGLSGASQAYVDIEGFLTDGRYLYQQYYGWTGSFVTGMGPNYDGGSSGLRPLFRANPDAHPEQSLKADIGVDAMLWNKLSIGADFFIDRRNDILTLDRARMDCFGYDTFYSNIGRMVNRGVELNVVYSSRISDFEYSVFGNLLFAKNKVLEMGEVGKRFPYNESTGLPYGSRMGLECVGFYSLSDFDLDGELNMGLPIPLFGSVQPGDLKYKDQDGDGIIDETDFVKIGNPSYSSMSFSFGAEFKYKSFDLSLLFTGTAGSTINLLDYPQWRTFEDNGNAFAWAQGAWVYYPEAKLDTRDTATYPRLSTTTNENNYTSSSFWIRKNNWLRLKNLELGYTVKGCRIFVRGYNLLTFSRLLSDYDMDPETVNYGYPQGRSYNAGIQITF